MTTPRLLDLFRGEGGASEGYRRVGFEVYAVDRDPRVLRRGTVAAAHTGDALAVLRTLLAGRTVPFSDGTGSARWLGLWDFAAAHASPPCQGYTIATLDRHRLFESNLPLHVPAHRTHGAEQVGGVYGGSRRAKRREGETLAEVAPRDRHAARVERGGGYVPRSKAVQQALLGIDWMTIKGMQESIPPVYAEHIGRQLLAALEVAA